MKEPVSWYHTNRHNSQAACEHCGGIIRHEHWCITRDPIVYYAYDVVVHPEKLSPGDALILHSLGVAWDKPCGAKCQTEFTQSSAAARGNH